MVKLCHEFFDRNNHSGGLNWIDVAMRQKAINCVNLMVWLISVAGTPGRSAVAAVAEKGE